MLGYSGWRHRSLHPVCAARLEAGERAAEGADAVLLSGWARTPGRETEAALMLAAWRGPDVPLLADATLAPPSATRAPSPRRRASSAPTRLSSSPRRGTGCARGCSFAPRSARTWRSSSSPPPARAGPCCSAARRRASRSFRCSCAPLGVDDRRPLHCRVGEDVEVVATRARELGHDRARPAPPGTSGGCPAESCAARPAGGRSPRRRPRAGRARCGSGTSPPCPACRRTAGAGAPGTSGPDRGRAPSRSSGRCSRRRAPAGRTRAGGRGRSRRPRSTRDRRR